MSREPRIFLAIVALHFLLMSSPFSEAVSLTLVKRQAPGNNEPLPRVPSEDLLPPPALSSSFPTLRPPIRQFGGQTGPFQSVPVRPPGQSFPQTNSGAPPVSQQNGNEEYPLLPPIEIPPEKPLLDSEITHVPPAPTSFVPTTGQGANHHFTLGPPIPTSPVASANSQQDQNVATIPNAEQNPTVNPPSNVRFPEPNPVVPSNSSPPRGSCPVCECTSEVDYICGSNGVLYRNSCSFDCATFCDAGKYQFFRL